MRQHILQMSGTVYHSVQHNNTEDIYLHYVYNYLCLNEVYSANNIMVVSSVKGSFTSEYMYLKKYKMSAKLS